MSTVLRGEEEQVRPLELFFDLVFVLAITQCTALMSHEPTWQGLAKGMLVLGVLWWSWVGYSWLTSVVDPEEGAVRLTIFAAMAALLVAALCVPTVFDDTALLFAGTYAVVRGAQIVLFVLASRDDPGLRHSVLGLALSTAVGTGLLIAASFADGTLQGAVWALALALDMGGPLVIESSGWRLEPHHFAERHGLIVLIALGESIVAIGVGAEARVDAGVVAAAVSGTIVAAVPATALLGGTAVYLLAHVAFRWRNVHRFSSARLIAASACLVLIPVAVAVPALATLWALAALLCALVVYERARFAELRARLRHPASAPG